MSEDAISRASACCECCEETVLTGRERALVRLAYQFAAKDGGAVTSAIVSAKKEGVTNEEIEEVCSIVAEASKESILSLIASGKKNAKTNNCCA